MAYDIIIKNGRFFDGSGGPSGVRHLGIRDGRVEAISESPLDETGAKDVIDATDRWVMPGFLDNHTHYDAELLAAPGLTESVRHGVTTIVMGSCSLSTVCAAPKDCADLFSRVEALPREHVVAALEQHKTWQTPTEYVRFLEQHHMGPNVAMFLGHSDIRSKVMGLGRSVNERLRPTPEEMKQMEDLLEEALDVGFLGLSTMTNPWDKLDGERYRSSQLPSCYAGWGEYGRLHKILRKRRRILQSAPNITTKVNTVLFALTSAGLFFRRPLKVALITAADTKAYWFIWILATKLAGITNRLLRGNMKWQTVPMPFEVYADGMDLVVFEEFGAGEAALHLADELERNELLKDEAYRRWFRRDYESKFQPRVWHRDFYDAEIVDCPNPKVIGKTFGQVADEQSIHPVDAFLDLVVEHGRKLRWKTTIANHRPEILRKITAHSGVHIGFADSGAHVRNMAFYNFPLHFLRMAKEAQETGEKFMSLEKAVWRLTGEQADWYNVDAGRLAVGRRADVTVVNPAGLNHELGDYHEEPVEMLGGMPRMVRRNDEAVSTVIINGRVAYREGKFSDDYCAQGRWGRLLKAGVADSIDTPLAGGTEMPVKGKAAGAV
ncbi:amidohydrolase family protein [bacterium]|nr:amidohydrolase family protein [bacterium]